MIREISLEKVNINECQKYLKKIKIQKFGLPKFKETENLINFLKIAYKRRYLYFKDYWTNNHLERIFIMTNSMMNTYKIYG